ncbi:MAG: glycosyltransferase family 4 protein [Methanomicrobiales archaeon]
MKICIIGDGRSNHTLRWASYFAARHEVHLITYDPVDGETDGVMVHLIPACTDNLYLSFLPRQRKIHALVRRIQPDIIHAHFVAKFGFHLPLLRFRPSVVSAWGDDILILPKKSRLISLFTRAVLRYVDLVYAVSRNIQAHIVDDFGIDAEKTRYMPFGIDTDAFSPPSKERGDTGEITIFSNRGFFPVYDTATLIEGFECAYRQDPRLRLILKGGGPERKQMRELVREGGLEDIVTFRERTPYSEVVHDYREADIFVSTAISDGTPVSLLEAMSSGLPCIATDVGGVPEWIEDGKTGVLIPPGDPGTLAEKILLLAEDAEVRRQIGAGAREKVVREADWEHLMVQAEQDYQRLIQQYTRE